MADNSTMKTYGFAFAVLLLFQQQQCDLQKALREGVEPSINTPLMNGVRKSFPNATRVYHPQFQKAIVVHTGVTGISEEFALRLVPQLGEAGLRDLGTARKSIFGLLGAIPYESIVFLFNMPPGVDATTSDVNAPDMVMIQWLADYNTGIVLTGLDIERCETDFTPCRVKMESQLRAQAQPAQPYQVAPLRVR